MENNFNILKHCLSKIDGLPIKLDNDFLNRLIKVDETTFCFDGDHDDGIYNVSISILDTNICVNSKVIRTYLEYIGNNDFQEWIQEQYTLERTDEFNFDDAFVRHNFSKKDSVILFNDIGSMRQGISEINKAEIYQIKGDKLHKVKKISINN